MNKDLQKANDKSHNDILLEDQKNKNDIANAEEVVKK